MTEQQTSWRGVLGRWWPVAVAAAVVVLVNPVIGAVTALVLALWRGSRDRPLAAALVVVAVLAVAYVAAFSVGRVG